MLGEKPEAVLAELGLKMSADMLLMEAEKLAGGAKNATKLAAKEIGLKYASKVKEIAAKYGSRFKKLNLPLPDADFLHHVMDRHFPGGANLIDKNGLTRSIFNAGEDFVAIALEGWEKGKIVSARVREYDMGRIIGKTGAGQETTMVRIVLDHQGKLLTMFPI